MHYYNMHMYDRLYFYPCQRVFLPLYVSQQGDEFLGGVGVNV